jgi:hypothetical protein
MRSVLELNRRYRGDSLPVWEFSGNDERALADCLDQLDEYAVDDFNDRRIAAIVFRPTEGISYTVDRVRGTQYRIGPAMRIRAWNVDGALALADLLPERLADLREDLLASFTPRT